MAGPSVTRIATVSGVRGERVACGPGGPLGGRRAAARDALTARTRSVAPRPLAGALRFSASGDALLAGTERFELPGGTWAALRDPRPAVADGDRRARGARAAAWDAGGALLAVAAALPPVLARGRGGGSRGRAARLAHAARRALADSRAPALAAACRTAR